MFVPNFEAINHVTLVLGPENHPESLAEEAVSLKNGFKIPFRLNQPTFGRHEFFFLFLLFFAFFS